MIESAVLTALKDKRARLAYDLKEAELRVVALRTDLASVDNCLRIFGSGIDPETIRAKITQGNHPPIFLKARTRTALEILRETGQPMSIPELAACILQRFGKPLEERSLSLLVKTIQGNFSRRTDGIVEFVRDSYPGKWRLVTPLLSGRK